MPDYSSQKVDIVKRLKYWEGEYHYPAGLLKEAAKHIEELRNEIEKVANAQKRPRL